MNDKPKESDWKLYRKLVPELRERYLTAKNREFACMLTGESKTPTECFWDTLDEMRKEEKILVECLDRQSRSRMFMSMTLMCRCGILKREDLHDFSDELQGELERCLKS
jgi:hypothetical protein